tara:strand:+ start:28528 stop:29985 length:1458 start_codon:yes stop_codon:yes gene_type:complete
VADKLTISKVNESTLRIQCDRGVGEELSDFFCFYVPGYRFMPAYRNKVWDGRIRLYNSQSQELPVGLFTYVTNFASKRGYLIDTEKTNYGSPWDVEHVSDDDLFKHIENLKLPFKVRDYQYEAIKKAIAVKRAIILSPTGSGKSLIIYILAQYMKGKVLIIVPTTSLVEQMHGDFCNYGYDKSHRIYSGKDKDIEYSKVVISTWQSIYKFPKAWFKDFDLVVGDECHGFKSKSLTTLMNKCTETSYRIGTTGTLDGTQTHKLVLEGLFGRVWNATTTKDLQDSDTLAKLKINIIKLKYQDQIRKDFKKDYQDEVDYIVTNEKRNNFIKNLTIDQKGNTLVLFQFVEKHGKVLFKLIKDNVDQNRKVFFVSGEVAASDREAIRHITEKQTDAIVVASMGTFSTGVNIRNLHNIVFASPSKSQIRVLQSIGRGLRKSDDGKPTKLYDIADDISWKNKKNFVLQHAAERVKIYDKERFDYREYEIPLS